MNILDFAVFLLYMAAVLSVGFYFFRKNETGEDYYVGSRAMSSHHVGISIVATDVGGGFSIGLGGLGFVMGLSGSWLLFTGLVGAWLTAVVMIPRIKKVDALKGMTTFPDFLRHSYGNRVALIAALISGIGYLGFTGGQILAGAKLAAATLFSELPWDIEPLHFSLYLMTAIILIYTVMGGLKAVIYTDTVQWIVLMAGLLIAVPLSITKLGGWNEIRATLPSAYFTLTNVSWVQIVNWFVTIIPIWFIGMTLYQRIYACRNTREAQRAWFIAGLFEYPVIAFVGVTLGMISRVWFPDVEAEMGLPLLLKTTFPIGITGLVVAAYFSAIMSTADSCLIASSGNFVNDLIQRYLMPSAHHKKIMIVSQVVTLLIGALTLWIASSFQTVLEIILHAYAFMVAGLFVPTLGALFWKKSHPLGAFLSMIFGGGLTLVLIFSRLQGPFGLDPSFYGILVSLVIFIVVSLVATPGNKQDRRVYE